MCYDTFTLLCFRSAWLASCPRAKRFYRDVAVALLVSAYLVGWAVQRTLVLLAGDDVTRNTSQLVVNFIHYTKCFFRTVLKAAEKELEHNLKPIAQIHSQGSSTNPILPVSLEVKTPHRNSQASEDYEDVGIPTMTIRELKAMARERGLKGYSNMHKAEPLEALST